MNRYLSTIAQRLPALIAVMIGVTLLTFFIGHIAPANPAQLAAGLQATRAQVETITLALGLNHPLYIQYWDYLTGLLHGDMGISSVTLQPIAQDLWTYLPATVELVIAATVVAVPIGVYLGVVGALHPQGWQDRVAELGSLAVMSMPQFWIGIMLQVLFSGVLHWLPAVGELNATTALPPHMTGMVAVDAALSGQWATFGQAVQHLIMPTIALSSGSVANIMRITRSSMRQVLRHDYVRTAHAKGLPMGRVVLKHVFRNAAVPVVTIAAIFIGGFFAGDVLVEIVFSWPGIGQYLATSITYLDYTPILDVCLLTGFLFVLLNLAADLCYMALDPRVKA